MGASGVVAAAVAVGAESRLLGWIAGALLAGSVLLRLATSRSARSAARNEQSGKGHGDGG